MLAVVGDIVQDTVIWLGESLQEGSDTRGEVYVSRGGSAANVAAAAAPLTPTRFIGCVGQDFLGEILAREMVSCGVDVRLQLAGTTGVIVVLIDEHGERTMIPSRGACLLLRDVPLDWLDTVSVLHVTSYSLDTALVGAEMVRLAQLVHARGGKVTLDASSSAILTKIGKEQYAALLAQLRPDVFFANEQEWQTLNFGGVDAGGRIVGDLVRPSGLTQAVLVRKAGPNPTIVFAPGAAPSKQAVPPVATVLDTTGAGDAFTGAFLAAMIAQQSWDACAQAGHRLAAKVLSRPGATLTDQRLG